MVDSNNGKETENEKGNRENPPSLKIDKTLISIMVAMFILGASIIGIVISQFSDFRAEMRAEFAKVHNRFDSIDAKFDALILRFDGLYKSADEWENDQD